MTYDIASVLNKIVKTLTTIFNLSLEKVRMVTFWITIFFVCYGYRRNRNVGHG